MARATAAALALLALVAAAHACDDSCLSEEAVKLMNAYRATQGMGAVEQGPDVMLNNALRHSRFMAGGGPFEHQDLAQVSSILSVCGLYVSAENIAMFGGGARRDAPARCIDMWIGSEGHRRNLLSGASYSVVGVSSLGNAVYCTQTFAGGTVFDDAPAECRPGAAAQAPETLQELQEPEGPPPAATTVPAVTATPAVTAAPATTAATARTAAVGSDAAGALEQYADSQPAKGGGDATCTPHGERCMGMPGYAYVEWLGGCCAASDSCTRDARTSALGWGFFCVPRDGGAADTVVPHSGESQSGYWDRKHRKFFFTGRTVALEEECTYNSVVEKHFCILCVAGRSPPVCFGAPPLVHAFGGDEAYEAGF